MKNSPREPEAAAGVDPNVSRRRFLTGAGVALGALAAADPAMARALSPEGGPPPTVYDVTTFGAQGDGVADDRGSIQAAIDAANGAGGGTIVFPAGTFRVTGPLTIYSQIVLRGAGLEATTIKKSSGAGSYPILRSPGFVPGNPPPPPIRSFSLQNISLDGNRQGGAGGNGMEIYAYGYTLFNMSVANCAGRGIWTEYHGLLPPDGKPVEAMWLNVTVHNCVGGGVYFNGPHDSQWTNVIVFMCGPPGIQQGSTTRGVEVALRGTGLRATNCHSWGLNQAYAWWLDTDGPGLVNCTGEGAELAQVVVLGNDTQIVGGKYYGSRDDLQAVAIQIGEVGHVGPAGTFVNTKVVNCNLGALKFVRDRGVGRYILSVWQTTGSAVVRVPTATVQLGNRFDIDVNGGAVAGTDPLAPVTFQENVLARRDVQLGGTGTRLGLFGAKPAEQSSGWDANLPDRRNLDGGSDLEAVRNTLATLIAELKRYGLLR